MSQTTELKKEATSKEKEIIIKHSYYQLILIEMSIRAGIAI